MKQRLFFVFLLFILNVQFSCAAHYIVGIVNDAADLTSADDHEVVLWNLANGISDNVTDIIGVNGNSNTENVYMIDCEMLEIPCQVGDTLSVKVYDTGDGYFSQNVSVVVTGAGFNLVQNITLNSPPIITSVLVDDDLTSPLNEIDLITSYTRNVTCEGVIEEFDGESLNGIYGVFYDTVQSFMNDNDDNNFHYTNSSCFVNSSYGNENQSKIYCTFDVWYYANSQNWRCVLSVNDSINATGTNFDETTINQLLSVEVNSTLDFGSYQGNVVTDESLFNVTNLGNVEINLSLYGFAGFIDDGWAMNCSNSQTNISIDYLKYNLTASTPGELTLPQFDNFYTNLTGTPLTREFNLDYRQNDTINKAVKPTYWRIFVPNGIYGSCQGNIVFGAVVGGGI